MRLPASRRSGVPSRSRRAAALLGVALAIGSLGVALVLSRMTGPSFEELARIALVDRLARVVTLVARDGAAAFTAPETRAAFLELEGKGTLAPLLAAWAKLSLGRVGVVDPLTSARLPWLVLGALGPALLFAVVVPSRGLVSALVSALVMLAMPSFLHGVALGNEAVAIAGGWLAVLTCYVRSLGAPTCTEPPIGRRARVCWAAGGASALGLVAALAPAALGILPILIGHFWLSRLPATRRLVRRGRVPVPALVALSLLLLPLLFVALNPPLWALERTALARWLSSPLSPAITPALLAGATPAALPVPSARYALVWLFMTLPTTLLVAAVVGLVLSLHRGLARIFASGRPRPPRDRHGLGVLVAIGLALCVLGPALAPAPLVVFPPRVELALPFVAIAAGFGLVAAARALGRGARVAAALVVACLVAAAFHAPRTLGSAYAPLFGGCQRVVARKSLRSGDGSELELVARAIDALGRPALELHAPDVPPELWRVLREARRMKTEVRTVRDPRAPAVLVRGASLPRPPTARVERGGAVLWSLQVD